jgi:hypothetical protein
MLEMGAELGGEVVGIEMCPTAVGRGRLTMVRGVSNGTIVSSPRACDNIQSGHVTAVTAQCLTLTVKKTSPVGGRAALGWFHELRTIDHH